MNSSNFKDVLRRPIKAGDCFWARATNTSWVILFAMTGGKKNLKSPKSVLSAAPPAPFTSTSPIPSAPLLHNHPAPRAMPHAHPVLCTNRASPLAAAPLPHPRPCPAPLPLHVCAPATHLPAPRTNPDQPERMSPSLHPFVMSQPPRPLPEWMGCNTDTRSGSP